MPLGLPHWAFKLLCRSVSFSYTRWRFFVLRNSNDLQPPISFSRVRVYFFLFWLFIFTLFPFATPHREFTDWTDWFLLPLPAPNQHRLFLNCHYNVNNVNVISASSLLFSSPPAIAVFQTVMWWMMQEWESRNALVKHRPLMSAQGSYACKLQSVWSCSVPFYFSPKQLHFTAK